MIELLLILIPIAAIIGWYYGYRRRQLNFHQHLNRLSRDYFVGLNFLLNEQPDKAVDIFIKLLAVDSETVETHLALGNLFRRRGEIDRAIKVHQNIIARPNLEPQQRTEALAALAQDYYRAGMLDRAERLFLEVLQITPNDMQSLQSLLDIYQQQKRWEQAIVVAKKVNFPANEKLYIAVAQYYCELAQKAFAEQQIIEAKQLIEQALQSDPSCVRANLLLGDYELANHNYMQALECYQKIPQQDPDFLTEALPAIAKAYQAINDETGLLNYLTMCLQEYPRVAVVLALTDVYYARQGINIALEFLNAQLKQQVSLKSLLKLLDLQRQVAAEPLKDDLTYLYDLIVSLLKNKPVYRCIQCGLSSKKIDWQCPSCKSWGVVRRIRGIEGE